MAMVATALPFPSRSFLPQMYADPIPCCQIQELPNTGHYQAANATSHTTFAMLMQDPTGVSFGSTGKDAALT